MAKTKNTPSKVVKTPAKLDKTIEGYTWTSGEKEPIYKADPINVDCIGYTWKSGKKEPIKQVMPKLDGEDKGYTWKSGKKEPIK